MNLKISAYPSVRYFQKQNSIIKKDNYNPAFCGRKQKVLQNAGYAFLISSIFTLASCSNKNKQADNLDANTLTEQNYDNFPTRIYHYYPKDDLTSENYDWSEVKYPDGRVEKDSMDYKISVTPQGKRTVTKTEKDSVGNTIITTDFPDGEKTVRINYLTINPNEKLQVEKTYWKNGKLKESKFLSEHLSDSTNINSPRIRVDSCKVYNENEVLLYWESNSINPEKNDSNNIYDENNRILYDNIKNETYLYNDKNNIPYQSVSECEDCKRITLYDENGHIERIFFEASDGTITDK